MRSIWKLTPMVLTSTGALLVVANCNERMGSSFSDQSTALEHEHEDPPGDPQYNEPPSDLPDSGVASAEQVALAAANIPKFAQPLAIPPVLLAKNAGGTTDARAASRPEYELHVKQARVQMLPPPLPETTVLAYGGNVLARGAAQPEFGYFTPGPSIEAVRGQPHDLSVINDIDTPHFLAVDPTLHYANPNNVEPPVSPFIPFPPGYAEAQFPVAHVTHTHGLMVESEMDGVARQWFTKFGQRGPHYLTPTYRQPNDQPATHLWYHDHTIGMTRLNVYAGLAGNYFIRDRNSSLDFPATPEAAVLPSGKYEIPLNIADKGFFEDGELNFARVGINPDNPYWSVVIPSNTVVVNGKVWPNLDVEPRQYRFRILLAPTANLYTFAFDNAMSFTVIGSDGGYLPRPQVVQSLRLGVTERADVLVDFSSYAPGTKIVLLNTGAANADLGTVMQFTVGDAPPVVPPPLPAVLQPRVPLVQNGPTRTKTQLVVVDDRANISVLLDGVTHGQKPIDYPLVGSTERWDLVQNSGLTHLIHLHLIEFQVLDRQPIDAAAYNLQWLLLNGQPPLNTRPIVLDPAPFATGPSTPPDPYETGWKDSVQATGNMVTRILARWAPQELPADQGGPGINSFSIDPTTGPGYLWHCHILAHEDNEMMRDMPLINVWQAGRDYDPETVIQYQGVNYRAFVKHRSTAENAPPLDFASWDRVNDNGGAWAPQIRYVVGDRVLHEGRLFRALVEHQALANEAPSATPAVWQELPQTFCGQLSSFCAGNATDTGATCLGLGAAGDEAACQGQFSGCLAACAPSTVEDAGHHQDYASYCGQLASYCHEDSTPLGVECHDLGHAGNESACQARHFECMSECAPSRPTRADFPIRAD
jgi:spore coat protein A